MFLAWLLQLEIRKLKGMHEREVESLQVRIQHTKTLEGQVDRLRTELATKTRELQSLKLNVRSAAKDVRAWGGWVSFWAVGCVPDV